MSGRETAYRIFAGELNSSTLDKKGEDEMSPSYVITPLGNMINRIFIAGTLIEKENVGSEEEPMWKARIQDVSGSFFLNVGKFQPEAAAAMADLDTPSYVAVIGKIKLYSPEEGKIYVTIRAERIINIEESTRNIWLLEAARSLWSRLLLVRTAMNNPTADANGLVSKGVTFSDAENIIAALDHYDHPDSAKYLKIIQAALRILIPERKDDIDFGLPEEVGEMPDDMEIDDFSAGEENPSGEGNVATEIDKEELILSIIDKLDQGGSKGVDRDEIVKMAAGEGLAETEVEEISDRLMDIGQVYEPVLGYLKKI